MGWTMYEQEVRNRLFLLLDGAGQPGEVYINVGYVIESDPKACLGPDISVTHANQPAGDYFEGAPLLAVELVSASQSAADLEAKTRIYLAHGSREVWLVYPEARQVRICWAGGSRIERETIRSELLPGLGIRLEQIFAEEE